MLDPKLKDRLAEGYTKLGDLGYKLAQGLNKGKDDSPKQKEMWDQVIKMRYLLQILFRHVTFDEATSKPTLWNITEEQVNRYLRYLLQIGELDTYPVVPTILPTTKPVIFNKGVKGDQGIQGEPGSNANIVVRPVSGETEIIVTEVTDLDGTKAFELDLNTYSAQGLIGAFQGTKIFEVGNTVESIDYLITSSKGSNNILTLTITDDGTLNTALQSLISLPILNGPTQPVQYTVTATNVTTNKTVSVQSDDGTTIAASNDSISFFYPYLSGSVDALLTTNHYTSLTKTIAGQSNRSFLLNGLDDYHYIMYPSSYGTLTQLKDDNGFNVIGSFTTGLVNVTSSGLDVNWTTEYRFYRTTIKTDINNKLYSIVF